MPRTPAPLTVEHQLMPRGGTALVVTDSHGTVIANFKQEADAHAFVALPQFISAVENARSWDDIARALADVTAPADGPSPKEEE